MVRFTPAVIGISNKLSNAHYLTARQLFRTFFPRMSRDTDLLHIAMNETCHLCEGRKLKKYKKDFEQVKVCR